MSEVTQTLIDDAQAHSQSESRITARDLRSVFWRSFTLQGSWNYERQQHMGYAFAMSPALKRIYQTPPNWARLTASSGAVQYHAASVNVCLWPVDCDGGGKSTQPGL